jgi:hypothetical protein
MFFYLVVVEFVNVNAVNLSCLSSHGLIKIINYFSIRIGLFDVFVLEVDNSVTVREYFLPDSLSEDDFFFLICVPPDNLAFAIQFN